MDRSDEQVTMVLVPQSELDSLKKELKEIKDIILLSKEDAFMNRWVESEDARKQLGVCGRTWQAMRDKRMIPFTQFGRKIYFRQSDIEAFLIKNIVR